MNFRVTQCRSFRDSPHPTGPDLTGHISKDECYTSGLIIDTGNVDLVWLMIGVKSICVWVFGFGQSGSRDGKWELAGGEAEETRTPSSGPWMWRGEETGAQVGQCLARWQRWERCRSRLTLLTLRVSVKQYAENIKLRHSCTGIWNRILAIKMSSYYRFLCAIWL